MVKTHGSLLLLSKITKGRRKLEHEMVRLELLLRMLSPPESKDHQNILANTMPTRVFK